jgi:CheY-like chemotaxis protein
MGKNLLVAEDNPVNRVLLDLILSKRKHRVKFVGSGREVLAACDSQTFDLILMDLQLPEIDGLEVTRQLRRQGRSEPIVGLTADASDEARHGCLEAGMRVYLAKPVQPGELLDVIDELLRS